MSVSLDRAVAVTSRDGDLSAQISEDWCVWGPNGGYLAAIVMEAALSNLDRHLWRPVCLMVSFLKAARVGQMTLCVDDLRAGRRICRRIQGIQAGVPVLEGTVWLNGSIEEPEYLSHNDRIELPHPLLFPTTWQRMGLSGPLDGMQSQLEDREVSLDKDPGTIFSRRNPGPPKFEAWWRLGQPVNDPFHSIERTFIAADLSTFYAGMNPHRGRFSLGKYIAPTLSLIINCTGARADTEFFFTSTESPALIGNILTSRIEVRSERGEIVALMQQSSLGQHLE